MGGERGAWQSGARTTDGHANEQIARRVPAAPCVAAADLTRDGSTRLFVEALRFFEKALPISSSCFYWIDAECNAVHQQLHNLDASWLSAYREEFHRSDPLHPRRWLAESERVASLDGLSRLRNRDVRNYVDNFLLPQNTPHQAEIYFWQDDRMVAGISLLRTGELGAFTSAEKHLLQSALPLIDLSLSLLPEVARPGGVALTLTRREAEIATMVAGGDSNKVICRKLGIELPTVKTHLKRIFQKAGVASRTELISKLFLVAH